MIESSRIIGQPLTQDILESVIRIHQESLPYSLNSRLGRDHLRFLYGCMSNDPSCYVGVAIVDEQAVGVVSGTLDVGRLRSKLLHSMSTATQARLALRLGLSPSLLILLWRSSVIARPIYVGGQEVAAELTAIGIDSACRGEGLGGQLVQSLEAFFSANRARVYRLDTLQENAAARGFYQRLGFREIEARAGSYVLVKELAG